jgi:two-component sensor histidine kinase
MPLPNVASRSRSAREWLGWWIVASIWWTLDGFTDVMNYRVIMPGDEQGMARIWRAYMWSAWLWIPLTIFALWLCGRFPIGADRWRRNLLVLVGGAALACVARAIAVALLNPWVGWYASLPGPGEMFVTSIANNFFPYWMLVGVGHAVVYARRIRERDEQLSRAELHALKLQLQPHFLFNTLNTINTYVRAEPSVAQRMIARLSDLLRRVLDSEGIQEVTLQEELELVRTYLDIEQVRFDERLGVQWTIDPETVRAIVPHLVLQPIVENAIRHGIGPQSRGGTVEIAARRRDSSLELVVRDDGAGMDGSSHPSGRGLTNTRNRLRQLYSERQSVRITAPPGGGFVVELTMPFRAAPSASRS